MEFISQTMHFIHRLRSSKKLLVHSNIISPSFNAPDTLSVVTLCLYVIFLTMCELKMVLVGNLFKISDLEMNGLVYKLLQFIDLSRSSNIFLPYTNIVSLSFNAPDTIHCMTLWPNYFII